VSLPRWPAELFVRQLTIKQVIPIALTACENAACAVLPSTRRRAELPKLAVTTARSSFPASPSNFKHSRLVAGGEEYSVRSTMASHLLVMTATRLSPSAWLLTSAAAERIQPNGNNLFHEVAANFSQGRSSRLRLNTVNAGGGFPVPGEGCVPTVEEVLAHSIRQSMGLALVARRPYLMLEPGRSLVAEALSIQCEVVLVARKSFE